jgi:hypothetical protein
MMSSMLNKEMQYSNVMESGPGCGYSGRIMRQGRRGKDILTTQCLIQSTIRRALKVAMPL